MSREPTQEYLKECFNYVDGKLYWKERPRHHFNTDRGWKMINTKNINCEAGWIKEDRNHRNHSRYYISVSDDDFLRSRIIWVFHNGSIPNDKQIDHKNGDTLNDKIENLRCVDVLINANNKAKQHNNKTGVSGVFKHPYKKKLYSSRAYIDGKQKQLYYGDDFFEAVCVRKSWECKNPLITKRHGK